jgi:hypothetical protein
MAEFWRALKALRAEQADLHQQAAGADLALELPVTQLVAPAPVRARPSRSATRLANADLRRPNEPEPLRAYVLPEPPMAGPAMHEPPACTPRRPEPNEPERASQAPSSAASPTATRSGTAARPEAAAGLTIDVSGRAAASRGRLPVEAGEFLRPGMNLAGSVRWRIGAEKRLL